MLCSTAKSESPYSSILGRWWPLVAVARVLDGELVQAELVLQGGKLPRARVLERDPNETFGPADVLFYVLDRDVGEFFPFLIGGAVDQHGCSPNFSGE